MQTFPLPTVFHLQSQSAAVQENKMTVTLIAVVLLFLVCQTPTAIFLIYTTFVGVPGSKEVGNLWKGEWDSM